MAALSPIDRRQLIAGTAAAMLVRPAAAQPAARLRAALDASAAAADQLTPTSSTRRAPAFVDPLGDAYELGTRARLAADRRALAAIDRDALPPIDRVARDVFAYKTAQDTAFLANGAFAVARRAPLDASFGLHLEFADFVAGDAAPFATAADYDLGLRRLDGFAAYLDSAVTRLRQGLAKGQVQPAVVVQQVLAQVAAVLALPVERSPFYAAIGRMPATIGAADRARFAAAYRRVIETRIYPGYARWQAFLSADYLPRAAAAPGRWAMKGGPALYAAELARHTTTTMDAGAIHANGVAEVARIRGEMERTRTAIGFAGDLPALFAFIRTDPRFYCKTEAELLGRFAAIEARIRQGLPQLFARVPRAPFSVQPLPALGATRGTGYYRPGAPDGRSPGILFFNMAMLPTRPIPTLETLTLHEGLPGHHFQITLARENDRLPPLLRMPEGDGFTAFTEGWGLYAESLGRELGLFAEPYQWFGHLDMEMLRAARLVVDTGLHAMRWERSRAIDYLLANTSMAPGDVAVEIDRYISAPGQACAYKVGELRLHAMRGRAAKALGSRFTVRDFHDQVLGTGALPLAVLDGKVDDWIARGGGPGGSGFA